MAKGLLYGAGAAAAAVTERRGTTAAHVLDQLGSPLPGAARLEHKPRRGRRLGFEPECKTQLLALPEGVHRARRRAQGGVCDGQTHQPRTIHETAGAAYPLSQRPPGSGEPSDSLGPSDRYWDATAPGCP